MAQKQVTAKQARGIADVAKVAVGNDVVVLKTSKGREFAVSLSSVIDDWSTGLKWDKTQPKEGRAK